MHQPPLDLPIDAAAKWRELADDIEGDLSPLQRDTLASYCRAFTEEQSALKLLDDCPNPFLVADDGKITVNPLRKIIDTARGQMQRLRRELSGKLTSTATTRGDCKRQLLLEIQRRHLEIANSTPTRFDRETWESELEHGPLFSPAAWFGCSKDDAIRMRWVRALASLVNDGFVVESREDGSKHSNVRLSEAGELAVAEEAA